MKTFSPSGKVPAAFLSILTIGVVVLSSNASSAGEQQPGQFIRFTNRQDGFTLTLPSGWKEMPPELGGIFVDPNAVPGHKLNAYGYQLASSERLLETPFVTVHVLQGIRIPERLLAMLTNEELRRKTVMDQLKREGFLERDVIETSYDTNRQVMQVSLSKTEHGVKMRALNNLIYTQKGVITVSCVAEAAEFDLWAKMFGQVMSSFEISPSIRYQARPGAEKQSLALEGARWRVQTMAFFFVGSIVWYFFQRRQNRVMSDEI
jgi:hypothetical protein